MNYHSLDQLPVNQPRVPHLPGVSWVFQFFLREHCIGFIFTFSTNYLRILFRPITTCTSCLDWTFTTWEYRLSTSSRRRSGRLRSSMRRQRTSLPTRREWAGQLNWRTRKLNIQTRNITKNGFFKISDNVFLKSLFNSQYDRIYTKQLVERNTIYVDSYKLDLMPLEIKHGHFDWKVKYI